MIKITMVLQDPEGKIVKEEILGHIHPRQDTFIGVADCPFENAFLVTFILYQNIEELRVIYQLRDPGFGRISVLNLNTKAKNRRIPQAQPWEPLRGVNRQEAKPIGHGKALKGRIGFACSQGHHGSCTSKTCGCFCHVVAS